MRKCKIVATIGPASQDYDSLEQLIRAGVNVVRLNFSHGTHENHQTVILRTREISKKLNIPIGILQDLQGPKLRIGILSAPLPLAKDELVRLVPQDNYENSSIKEIPIDFIELFSSVNQGNMILINDGAIHLEVLGVLSEWIEAKVIRGGNMSSQQGINLPGIKLDIPAFTKKDEIDLAFGLSLGIDAVAISFVRTAEDVLRVSQIIKNHSREKHPLLIAKLEKPEAMDHLVEIIEAADGVMVARGDLGVEMKLEEVPVAQKRIIRTANEMNKLVITATQMLESMIQAPSPTRAEASDVANAIFDGTDMVMLSGETAIGYYPLESVAIMDRIICQSEAAYMEWGDFPEENNFKYQEGVAIVKAARELAHARNVAAIAVFTRSGQTANLMAKMRPQVPIVAFTPEEGIYQRLSLFWGVYPQRVPLVSTVEEMIKCVEIEMLSSGLVSQGQQVVLIFGYPIGTMVPPNMTLLHQIGEK
ncbi:MAG: pyruvate kinase [Chloroflexi bacterium GWB2_49_20]|nr:MAG: pyruvate kinase [Chloroflexi bacterium GWB2_49_20]OGN80021.1 MAG: pyruvate kinase [Chloroflexi bacterium GWC2_49_37]OGN85443.1 MAG: pyruvate kinase [Chloroflexi bacterium GWD2_49_16]